MVDYVTETFKRYLNMINNRAIENLKQTIDKAFEQYLKLVNPRE